MRIEENPELLFYINALRTENEKDAEDGKPHRLFVMTFGCQQNEADSEKIRGYAESFGYRRAQAPEDADLILYNTCAIREHAEQKALSLIGRMKHLKEKNPAILVGVCGCMTAEAHRVEELRTRYPYVDFTLDPATISRLPEVIYKKKTEKKRLFFRGEEKPENVEGIPVQRELRHRAFVSIMYGCNNFCSYCIVPYVRGRERSRASADIMAEVKKLVADGCRDITLLGQNVNSYAGDCDFATLLSRLDGIPGDYVLRFMTSHPKDVSDDLIRVMAESTHIERHFHLPVQSGSDAVLRAMNRHYDRAHYLSIVKKLREAMPDIVLTTDIIVGFPGETEEDFSATLSLMDEVRFDMIYSFIYSPRKGTPAAERADAVPKDVQSRRFRELLSAQDNYAASCSAPYVGKTLRVLCDGPSKERGDIYSGRTSGGKLVHFTSSPDKIGGFVTVKIDRAEPYALYGTVQE